jgi:hypothetical protein
MSEEQRYIVTARKWRPLRFSDVVGQEHITTTKKHSIAHSLMWKLGQVVITQQTEQSLVCHRKKSLAKAPTTCFLKHRCRPVLIVELGTV